MADTAAPPARPPRVAVLPIGGRGGRMGMRSVAKELLPVPGCRNGYRSLAYHLARQLIEEAGVEEFYLGIEPEHPKPDVVDEVRFAAEGRPVHEAPSPGSIFTAVDAAPLEAEIVYALPDVLYAPGTFRLLLAGVQRRLGTFEPFALGCADVDPAASVDRLMTSARSQWIAKVPYVPGLSDFAWESFLLCAGPSWWRGKFTGLDVLPRLLNANGSDEYGVVRTGRADDVGTWPAYWRAAARVRAESAR